VYLRFASFDGAAGDEAVPELGPYAVIVVTRHGVEADGEALASRSATKDRAWVILRGGGPALVGIVRPDIAFRTRSTNYHPRIHQARLLAQPGSAPAGTAAQVRPTAPLVPPAAVIARPVVVPPPAPVIRPPDVPVVRPPAAPVVTPRAQTPPASAPAPSPPRDAGDDRGPLDDASPLRARLGGALRAELRTTQPAPSADELSRRSARRWAGFVLIGALVLGLGAFGAFSLRGALTPGPAGISVVGIGKAVKGTQFDYTVATVSRTPSVGASLAQGTYVIVFVTVTNHSDRATLTPSAFRLVDGGGAQFPPLSESDPVYQHAGNPGSPLVWMASYPVGRAVSTPVIFDVDASLRGVQLIILEVPTVRVRLD
jgi:hypothetical protein